MRTASIFTFGLLAVMLGATATLAQSVVDDTPVEVPASRSTSRSQANTPNRQTDAVVEDRFGDEGESVSPSSSQDTVDSDVVAPEVPIRPTATDTRRSAITPAPTSNSRNGNGNSQPSNEAPPTDNSSGSGNRPVLTGSREDKSGSNTAPPQNTDEKLQDNNDPFAEKLSWTTETSIYSVAGSPATTVVVLRPTKTVAPVSKQDAGQNKGNGNSTSGASLARSATEGWQMRLVTMVGVVSLVASSWLALDA